MENKHPATIGVDVSKDTLEVAILFTDNSFAEAQFGNDAEGIKQLLAWAAKHDAQQTRICVKANRNFELDLCIEGDNAGHPIIVARPTRVVSFCRSINLRNTADDVDARIIARFALVIGDDNYWKKPREVLLTLKDTLRWREHLTKYHKMSSDYAETLRDAELKKRAAAELNYFQEQIREIDALLYEIILKDEQLTHYHQLLRSIPGIETPTAAALCAVFTNHTFEHARQFGAFIGITPTHKQSEDYEAKAQISKNGNAQLRRMLFIDARSARVHNPVIQAFADKLSQRRPDLVEMQIIVACAHKLIRIIYGVLKYNKPFDPHHY